MSEVNEETLRAREALAGHYKEVLGDKMQARDILTDRIVLLNGGLHLQPKEVLILEL